LVQSKRTTKDVYQKNELVIGRGKKGLGLFQGKSSLRLNKAGASNFLFTQQVMAAPPLLTIVISKQLGDSQKKILQRCHQSWDSTPYISWNTGQILALCLSIRLSQAKAVR